MPHSRLPFDGTLTEEYLLALVNKLDKKFSLTADTQSTYAKTYEFKRYSFENHLRLLRPTQKDESLKHRKQAKEKKLEHRIVGVLWYGESIQQGLALEILGEDLENEFAPKLARSLRKAVGGIIHPISPRILTFEMYE